MEAFILAIDPGRTTGLVRLHASYNEATDETALELVEWVEAPWADRFVRINEMMYHWLYDFKHHTRFDEAVIIIEQFRLFAKAARQQINSDFEAVQVIGNVQMCAYLLDPKLPAQIIYLPPGVKNSVDLKAAARALLQGSGEHAKDAYKLGRYWWVTHLRTLLEGGP